VQHVAFVHGVEPSEAATISRWDQFLDDGTALYSAYADGSSLSNFWFRVTPGSGMFYATGRTLFQPSKNRRLTQCTTAPLIQCTLLSLTT
jgi:hypothetical protein